MTWRNVDHNNIHIGDQVRTLNPNYNGVGTKQLAQGTVHRISQTKEGPYTYNKHGDRLTRAGLPAQRLEQT